MTDQRTDAGLHVPDFFTDNDVLHHPCGHLATLGHLAALRAECPGRREPHHDIGANGGRRT